MARWWERQPARWEQELSALREAGLEFAEDVSAAARGVKQLRIRREHEGRTVELDARYPAEFPFFPPVVQTRDFQFERHQTPGTGILCLLAENAWQPASDTLAWMLTEQWDSLLASQPGPERNADVETQQAEPVTAYLALEEQSFVGFPEFDLQALPASGTFRFACDHLQPLRSTVLSLHRDDGALLVQSESRVEGMHGAGPVLTGRWVKLDTRAPHASAEQYYDIAASVDPALRVPTWQSVPDGSRVDVVALLFPDELTWQTDGGNAVVVSKTKFALPDRKLTTAKARLHRTELESHRLYALRDPGAPGLKAARVSLVGLGSIGSPLAKLLAQAGMGAIGIVDFDTLTAGNAVRWETGRSQAGRLKVDAIGELIWANFPFTAVRVAPQKLGNAHYAGTPTENALHDLLFHDVDCIVDAAASDGVSHYLCVQAMQRRRRHLWLYATNGGWGGFVGVSDADGGSPCWCCHMFYKTDGTIEPLVAAPETEGVHPPQCLDATFTGAQIDLMEVTLMAARIVADRCRTARAAQGGHRYPWTFATVALRDPAGDPIPPQWTTYALPPHPSCPYH